MSKKAVLSVRKSFLKFVDKYECVWNVVQKSIYSMELLRDTVAISKRKDYGN